MEKGKQVLVIGALALQLFNHNLITNYFLIGF